MKGVWTLSLGGVTATGPALQALYTSHGPPIVLQPTVSDYSVLLNVPTPFVALIPKIEMPAAAGPPMATTNETSNFWSSWNWPAATPTGLVQPVCDTRVRMTWNGMPRDSDGWVEAEPSALAMMKQIPLPEDGGDLVVNIDLEQVAGAAAPRARRYTVRVRQSVAAPPALTGLEAADDNERKCIVAPTLEEAVQDYYVYVDPRANRVTLNLKCRGSDSVTLVNGKKYTAADSQGFHQVTFERDLQHHTQLVQVSCTRPSIKYRPSVDLPSVGQEERRYTIRIRNDYSIEELDAMPTRLHIPALRQDCVFDHANLRYLCPDPQLPYHLVQLHTENNPTVKYTLFNSDRSVELRLLDKEMSVPFTYSGRFLVRLESGRFYKDYPLYFDGNMMRTFLSVLGSILGALLFGLTVFLLCIIGASSVFTLGFPIGATEIVGTFAFIIQYLCFSQTLKGSPRLTELTEPLKWFTLFGPAPVSFVDDSDCSFGSLNFPCLPGVEYHTQSGTSRPGDLSDSRNAQGALIWGFAILAAFLCVHLGVVYRFKYFERNYTFPHHIKLGGWEKRVLHALLFPMAVAATYCLFSPTFGDYYSNPHDGSSATATHVGFAVCQIYKVIAGLVLAGYVAWICYEAVHINELIKEGKVVWIWNASVREDGHLEDESGYWTDSLADQLLTQPLNRNTSALRRFFPFTWVSPVADIVPQRVLTGASANIEELRPTQNYRSQRYGEANYGLAKTPQSVEIIKCRRPGGLCRGQRLVAGLLRTTWIDILFTFESLTQLHANITGKLFTSTLRKRVDGPGSTSDSSSVVIRESSLGERSSTVGGHFMIPATVKTSQLSGPFTGGTSMFFFDGTRVPFIRIADCLYRLVVGVCLGIVLQQKSSDTYLAGGHANAWELSCRSGLFGLVAGVSVALLGYTIMTKPYTRAIEGWLSVATLATVSVSATAFSLYYLFDHDDDTTVLADLALWLLAACCFLLGAYSLIIDSSIVAAVICPPLDETRFLESLANVAVAISDEGKRVETPAFSKFPVQEILMKATQTGAGASGARVHVSVTPSKQEPCLEFTEKQLRQACQNGSLPIPAATVVARSRRERLGYKFLPVAAPAEPAAGHAIADFLTADEQPDAFTGPVAREIARHVKYQASTRGRNGQTLLTVNIAPPTAD